MPIFLIWIVNFPEDKTQEIQTRLPLRISCATGDVEKISSDYFGDSVNMSAQNFVKDTRGTILVLLLFVHGYEPNGNPLGNRR